MRGTMNRDADGAPLIAYERGKSHLALGYDEARGLWRALPQAMMRIEGLLFSGFPPEALFRRLLVSGVQLYPLGHDPVSLDLYERLCAVCPPSFGSSSPNDPIVVELVDPDGAPLTPAIGRRQSGVPSSIAVWGAYCR